MGSGDGGGKWRSISRISSLESFSIVLEMCAAMRGIVFTSPRIGTSDDDTRMEKSACFCLTWRMDLITFFSLLALNASSLL